jgi:ABC-2 type transport system ATP-binding protein
MNVVIERPTLAIPNSQVGSNAAVMIRGVSKRFPVRRGWAATIRHPFRTEWAPIVRNVTCDIEAGEFFGVLGPNGAGKTTLFRMLASTVLPDEGTIHVGGYDVVRQSRQVRAALAVVPAEERSLNWRLCARENLYLFGRMHRLSGQRLRDRVERLLEVVELADVGTKMVGKFSSGMKQRLMIARALIGSPRVLLLDEPTRALDPISARRLREFLRADLVESQGCTVILATHNSEEALHLCHRVAILDRGRMLAVGRASDLISEIQGYRYQVWTREPDHPFWQRLLATGRILSIRRGESDASGWASVDVALSGPGDEAATLLAEIVGAGISVNRFVPLDMSLADLIEQVVGKAGGGGGHA